MQTRRFSWGVAIVTVVAPFTQAALAADGTAATDPPQLEEIVVTAQKRSQNLQDVPLAVSVVTAAGLERYASPTIADLSGAVPNLYVHPTPGGASVLAVSIRGIQYAENEKTFEPPVGVVLDGVFLGTAQGGLLQSFDVERIEVLRGPQGTLFGRNTTGGAINAVRSRPTGELGGKVAATLGSFDRREVRAVLNLPIVEDVLAGKMSFAYERLDGVRNVAIAGKRDGDRRYWSGSGTLLFTPTTDIELLLTYDHVWDHGESPPVYPILQSTPTVLPTDPAIVLPPDTPCAAYGFCPPRDFRHSRIDSENIAHNDLDAITLNASWTIDDNLKLVSVTGYRDSRESVVNDFDATELLIFRADIPTSDEEQFSQELRLEGELGRWVDFVAGFFYFDANIHSHVIRHTNLGYITGNPALLGVLSPIYPGATNSGAARYDYDSRSYAAFAQADLRLTDSFTVIVGGRYTIDEKDIYFRRYNPDDTVTGPAQGALILQSIDTGETWKKFTPRVALTYDFGARRIGYVSFTRGYNAGGYSGRAADVTTVGPYDPETVDAYEVGFKLEALNRTLRLNVAAFRNDYQDKQEEVTAAITTPPFFGTSITNASSARIQGIEVEATAVPAEGLNVSASFGYLDAEYEDFIGNITGRGVTDNSGLRLRRTPEYTATVSGDYTFPIGADEISLGARYRYVDSLELAVTNDPFGHVPAGGFLDASIGYGMQRGGTHWTIKAYGRNLTDTIRQNVYFRTGGFLSFASANRGREAGLELTAKF